MKRACLSAPPVTLCTRAVAHGLFALPGSEPRADRDHQLLFADGMPPRHRAGAEARAGAPAVRQTRTHEERLLRDAPFQVSVPRPPDWPLSPVMGRKPGKEERRRLLQRNSRLAPFPPFSGAFPSSGRPNFPPFFAGFKLSPCVFFTEVGMALTS